MKSQSEFREGPEAVRRFRDAMKSIVAVGKRPKKRTAVKRKKLATRKG